MTTTDAPDFRVLFESDPELQLILSPDAPRFTIVTATDSYLRATLQKREAVLGRGLFDVFPDNPDDPAADGVRKLAASLRRVVERRVADEMAVQKYDIPRPERDGGGFEERWWKPRNIPVFARDGALVHIRHVVEDVTTFVHAERARAEQERLAEALQVRADGMQAEIFTRWQELHEANERLRVAEARSSGILAISADAIISIDADHRIVMFNDGAEKIFGWSRAEILGQPLDALLPEHTRGSHHTHVERFAGGSQVARRMGDRAAPISGLRKNGEEFPADAAISKLEIGGNVLMTVALRDITEQRRIESEQRRLNDALYQLTETLERRVEERTAERERLASQLHQAQKIEAIGTLASGIAHDFNNLLMGIGACVSLALSELGPDSSAREYLDECKRSVASGAAIARQLLTFGRRRATETTVFELDGAVAGTQRMIARLLGEDVELVFELGATGAHVLADRGQIEQVLLNLAINARDAMPHGGRITVVTSIVGRGNTTMANLPSGDYVKLTVRDSGCGMAEDVRARIFEPFFTTKEVGKGTGLGLSVVHGIVTQSRGHITVTSAPGQGTSFEILLPRVAPSTPSTRELEAVTAAFTEGATVLLVEDEASVRMGARFYLEQAGVRVLEAASGIAAIEICRNHTGEIDLLLSDVVLPGLGGAQIAEAIRAIRPDIAVVFMSAHARDTLLAQERIPADAPLVEKPFDAPTLHATIRRCLARRADALARTRSTEASAARAAHPREPSEPRAPAPSHAPPVLLLVEDEGAARMALGEYFADHGWQVLSAAAAEEALGLCEAPSVYVDVLLTDWSLPKMRGDQLARELRRRRPDVAIVYMSGRAGLTADPPGTMLLKPIDLDDVLAAVEAARAR